MAYNTCGAPVLFNYAHAKEWHDNTRPIRGNKDNVRPLGSRRHWHMGSISMNGDDVVLNYYGEPVVVWHPDDSLTVHCPRWATAFEPEKLAHFLPPRVNFQWNACRLVLRNEWDDSAVIMHSGQSVTLECVGIETWRAHSLCRKFKTKDVPQEYALIKRKGAAKKIIIEKLKPFIDWVDTIKDLSPRVLSAEHVAARDRLIYAASGVTEQQFIDAADWYRNAPWNNDDAEGMQRKSNFSSDHRLMTNYPMGGQNSYARQGVHRAGAIALYKMMLVEHQDQWLDALQIIAGHDCQRRWDHGDVYFKVESERIFKYVEKLVCHVFREQVIQRVPLAAGKVPTRTNQEVYKDVQFLFFENTDTVSDISV